MTTIGTPLSASATRVMLLGSGELGKEVELHAYNAEGELDRSLLERMVPPLEHMLSMSITSGSP